MIENTYIKGSADCISNYKLAGIGTTALKGLKLLANSGNEAVRGALLGAGLHTVLKSKIKRKDRKKRFEQAMVGGAGLGALRGLLEGLTKK